MMYLFPFCPNSFISTLTMTKETKAICDTHYRHMLLVRKIRFGDVKLVCVDTSKSLHQYVLFPEQQQQKLFLFNNTCIKKNSVSCNLMDF
jgi:hypothetical protein